MGDRVVILGAGQAGAQVAISLRERGFAGPILLVGDEPHLPYQRPPLSKAFLKGAMSAERLQVRPAAYYRSQSIELATSFKVAHIDVPARRLQGACGRSIGYDTLVIATGTRPRRLPIQGADLSGVHSVRGIADIERLRDALPRIERLAIIGGGYVGLEIAAVMRELGKDVTIIEAAPRILGRVTAAPVASYFRRLHENHGVRIITSAHGVAIDGASGVTSVSLADQHRVPADAVLIAVGAAPNQEVAQAAGVACDDGILVDAGGRTSAPDVYACGDCVRFPIPRYRRSVRIESVQNAIDQAKSVAANIVGLTSVYDPVPWFWSDQYDTKLQIAGLSEPSSDETSVVGDPASGSFSVEYRRGGRLVAVDAVNAPRAHMLARRAIAEETAASGGLPIEIAEGSGRSAAQETQSGAVQGRKAGHGPAGSQPVPHLEVDR